MFYRQNGSQKSNAYLAGLHNLAPFMVEIWPSWPLMLSTPTILIWPSCLVPILLLYTSHTETILAMRKVHAKIQKAVEPHLRSRDDRKEV